MKTWIKNCTEPGRKNNKLILFVLFIVLSIVLLFSPGYCQEKKADSFDTTEALIELLKQKGLIDEKEAKSFIERHKAKVKSTQQVITILPQENQEEYIKKVSKGVTQKVTKDLNELKENYQFRSDDLMRRSILLEREVERLEQLMKEEYKPQIQKSSWAQRIRFGGDIRLRHESVMFDRNNATNIEDPNSPGTFINATNDEHRQRIRLRVGAKAKLLDPTDINVGKVEAGVRIATGSVNNPVSTNHTLGHSSQDKSDIVLDRAYVKWTYKPEEEVWGNKIPQVSLTGGIMKNPWFSTSLVWDSDLAFEGVSANFITDTNEMNTSSGFLTLGYFPLEESEWTQRNKYMLGAQLGFKHRPAYGWEYKLGAAYYDYYNIEGQPVRSTVRTTADDRELALMAPKFMQKGNSLFNMDQTGAPNTTYGLLSDFELLNFTAKIENSLYFPIHVIVYGDWVKNLGYDPDSMASKSGTTKSVIDSVSGDIGYQVGLKVGYPKPKERWDWNVFVEYRYLESDAVLDAFTDSDFHLGGTNAKGFILGGELGIYENIWLSVRWMSANEITDLQFLDNQTDDLSVDTLQINLNAQF